MSRRTGVIIAGATLLALANPLCAQDSANTADQAQALAKDLYGPPPPVENCSAEQEAAIVSGEIVVCRRIVDQSQYRYSSKDEAETRYAEETERMGEFGMPAGLPADFVGPGIFKGPATVSGLCVIPPCPPPPALIIDLKAIPEAPPGSDADRVARGLAPRGNDGTPDEAEAPPVGAVTQNPSEDGEETPAD